MNPVAFSIFGLSIRWYGIIIASGILVAVIIAYFTCKIKEIDYETMMDIILISLPIGIIGARIYYVIFNLGEYLKDPIQMLNIRAGGLAIHGGIIFGVITAIIYTRKYKINFLKFADVAAPSVIIAQSIGRWGNFFNSEAHGGPVSQNFIKFFPVFIQKGMLIDGVYYHPTFLYESMWDLAGFIILICLLKKVNKKGIVFSSYIIIYSIGRFFIEALRTDSLMFGPLKMAQIVSIVGVVFGSIFIVYLNKHQE